MCKNRPPKWVVPILCDGLVFSIVVIFKCSKSTHHYDEQKNKMLFPCNELIPLCVPLQIMFFYKKESNSGILLLKSTFLFHFITNVSVREHTLFHNQTVFEIAKTTNSHLKNCFTKY